MMPGGDAEAYEHLRPIVERVAAQTDDGACVTYIGPGGAGKKGIVLLMMLVQPMEGFFTFFFTFCLV